MQRATITLDDEFVAELDRMISLRGYQNRSEAIRDLARAGMRQAAEGSQETGNCIAALVYVYDHESRDLSKRLTHVFHDHHELTHSAMHVHLDHGSCMERSEEHTSELQSRRDLVCRLLLEKKKKKQLGNLSYENKIEIVAI